MNRHTHSTSASLLVPCPRWQRWAPSLVWLGLVWFPLQSQSGPARPYSWFTSFAFPSFPNIIFWVIFSSRCQTRCLARWADFPINKLQFWSCVMILWSRPWLRQSAPGLNEASFLLWHNIYLFIYCFVSDVLHIQYCWSRLGWHTLHQSLIWKHWCCCWMLVNGNYSNN